MTSTTQTLPGAQQASATARPRSLARKASWLRWPVLLAVGLVLAIAVAATFVLRARFQAAPALVTAPVTRGTLVQTVSASGTVNPQDTVNVGTQVSGTLSELDVDYNSRVHVGQVLARIDPGSFQAQVDQARSQLTQAQAQAAGTSATVGGQEATYQSNIAQVAKAQSALAVANQAVARDRQLLVHGYVSQSQLDTDTSNAVAAQAALTAAHEVVLSSGAQIQTAQSAHDASNAAVQSAQAQLQTAQLNLERTVITSPVDGVVISRTVSVGQTVAASFQTPTLFSIAKDLSKMEVDLAVGEPDIGNARPGETIDFTVLAYPNTTFHGVVSQVRKNPTTVQNVVTYTVVTLVQNPDNKLLPGMTANASMHVAKVQNALIVPLEALQWRPAGFAPRRGRHAGGGAGGATVAGTAAGNRGAAGGPSAASPWGQTLTGAAGTPVAGGRGLLFLDKAGTPTPVRVSIDLLQGAQAAVTPLVDSALNEGDQIVVSDASASASTSARQNQSPLSGGSGGVGRALR